MPHHWAPRAAAAAMTDAGAPARARSLSRRHLSTRQTAKQLPHATGSARNNLPRCPSLRTSIISTPSVRPATRVSDSIAMVSPSGVVALDDQLDGSGANALHAAMALCDRVDLYGTGLYGRAPDGDKLYIHASDRDGVGQCAPLPEWCDHAVDGHLRGHSSVMSEPCGYPFRTSAGFNGRQLYKKWLQNRVHAELLTHIMAAMGMVRWM